MDNPAGSPGTTTMSDTCRAAQTAASPQVSLAGDPCTQFWCLAQRAIAAGLLTREEACLVARIGHRKQAYWARHVRDLEVLIAQRKDTSEGHKKGRTDAQ